MKIGFVIPNYPSEKRVAVLPHHLDPRIDYVFESDFGKNIGIGDEEYLKNGGEISSRDEIFRSCDYIFSLKLIQQSDYEKIRYGQKIIGWTHPTGSGWKFMQEIALPKNLTIVDLDNIYPSLYRAGKVKKLDWISKNFLRKNSFYAGFAAVQHSLLCHGLIPDSSTKVAILSPGNVSQGAVAALYGYNADVRIFYRTTMSEFIKTINEYDIIVNGIEMEQGGSPIVKLADINRTKQDVLFIDAAADAGGVIEKGFFTTHINPIGQINGRDFYCINNAPTFYYRTVSQYLSKALYENFFSKLSQDLIEI